MRQSGKFYIKSTGSQPGSKQYYKPVYSASNWNEFLRGHCIGTLLQVCCGGSHEGAVRVDLDPAAPGLTVRGNMLRLPFRGRSFDTVACDPIYGIDLLRRVSLQRELLRVARRRLIFKAPWVPRGRGWKLQDPVMGIFSHTFSNVSILAILDRQAVEADLFETR